MKLVYITNAKIPSEKARSLQIMKSCEAFATQNEANMRMNADDADRGQKVEVELVLPRRVNAPKDDPFNFYSVKRIFGIKKIFNFDLFGLSFVPRKFAFYVQSLSFGLFGAVYLSIFYGNKTVFYSRDFATLFFLCLFGFDPIAEVHDYRSSKFRWDVKYVLKNSRKVIVNSEGTLEQLRKHYELDASRVLVAPNGVDLEFFSIKESQDEARRILNIPQNKKVVAYIGRLETVGQDKGVGTLLEAFNILNTKYDIPNTHLLIVGGPYHLVEKYKAEVRNQHNITFTGQVEYQKVPLYLRAVDAVAIPLPKNQHAITTSPIKRFEYMAAGKAIVASDLLSIRQYLNSENAVFFDAENSEDLAGKLKAVLGDGILRNKISKNALQDATRYSWISRAQKIINFAVSKTSVHTLKAVLYFGDFDPNYARNSVIIKGLQKNGVEVLLCNDRTKGFKKYVNLVKKFIDLDKRFNLVIVGYSDSRFMVPLINILTRKKVVWDAFYSIYDNWIFDRKLAAPNSMKASYYWTMDWFSCWLSDLVLLDTQANADYFIRTFNMSRDKVRRVFIGADDEALYPKKKTISDKFIVEFHGNYIPVHGLEYIIKAAKILEKHQDIMFYVIGGGQEHGKIKKLAEDLRVSNITFMDKMPQYMISEYIKEADVCLGLLGNLDRGGRAIPNKVYEASAMERASLNMDGPAIHELYTDRENILLCHGGDSQDIADKILELKNNPQLKDRIAKNAYQLYLANGTPKTIGDHLIKLIGRLLF